MIRNDSNFNLDHKRALAILRKESLDIYNRLHSIQEDIGFVNYVHEFYPDFPFLRMSDILLQETSDVPNPYSQPAVRCLVYRSRPRQLPLEFLKAKFMNDKVLGR